MWHLKTRQKIRKGITILLAFVLISSGLLLTGNNVGHATSMDPELQLNTLLDEQSGLLESTAGMIDVDLNPEKSSLTRIGASDAFSFDQKRRSIGVDLGIEQQVNMIEMNRTAGATRIEKADLSLYVSNDNISYRKVKDWDFLKLSDQIILYNFSETARYVKIHNHYDDNSGTFSVANMQHMLKVYNQPEGRWTASGDGDWLYSQPLMVTNPNTASLLDRAFYITKAELGIAELVDAGKVQSDYRDIRFADGNGKELHYYVDNDGFYVRVPEMEASEHAIIQMYYGNPAALFRGDSPETFHVEYGNKTLIEHTVNGSLRDNPRMNRLVNGVIMLTATNRADGASGVYVSYSHDNGRTWSAPELLVKVSHPGEADAREEPASIYVDPVTGKVMVFFYEVFGFTVGSIHDITKTRCDLYVMSATTFDDSTGRPIFGEPQKLDVGFAQDGNPINYALTYTIPIMMDNGHLALPFHFAVGNGGSFATSLMLSEDNGETWFRSPAELIDNTGAFEGGATEQAIIQLKDGTVKMYFRYQRPDNFQLGVSTSLDYGLTWSPIEMSEHYSSNTLPIMTRHSNEDILMAWPGHNTLGGTSYVRHPFVLAYSNDETNTWNGYRSLLERTRLTTGEFTAQVITQPDIIRIENRDEYILDWWGRGLNGVYTLLIEDFDRYLYNSHGVFDSFEKPDVISSSWLANNPSDARRLLEISQAEQKNGSSALHMMETKHTEFNKPFAVSRLFPAAPEGEISFSIQPKSLSGALYMSLQEAFSDRHSAWGSAFTLLVEPDGTLKYTTSKQRVGYLNGDTSPTTSSLVDFHLNLGMAFDVPNRSLGVDLGDEETIQGITLYGKNASNRVAQSNVEVYVSNDNANWTLVTDWTFRKDGQDVVIEGMNSRARYVKVRAIFGNASYNMTHLDQQESISVSTLEHPSKYTPLEVPTKLNMNEWNEIKMNYDVNAQTMGLSVNGESKGQVGGMTNTSAAKTITHFLLESQHGTATDIYLDDFRLRDTSLDFAEASVISQDGLVALAMTDQLGQALPGGVWDELFSKDRELYALYVPYNVRSITVAPEAADDSSVVTYSFNDEASEVVGSEQTIDGLALEAGHNTLTLHVSTADGISGLMLERTYQIKIERESVTPALVDAMSFDAVSKVIQPNGKTMVNGIVIDANGEPLDGIEVRFAATGGALDAYVAVTDEHGAFQIEFTASSSTGAASISAFIPGTETVSAVGIQVGNGGNGNGNGNGGGSGNGNGSGGGDGSGTGGNGSASPDQSQGELKPKVTIPAKQSGVAGIAGAITVMVPPGAMEQAFDLSVEESNNALALGDGLVSVSSAFDVMKNVAGAFAVPIMVVMQYDESHLVEDQQPTIWFFDESKKQWVDVGGKVTGNLIAVSVTQAGKYIVAASAVQEEPFVQFTDIAKHWAAASIVQAVQLGIVNGYEDATFQPDEQVSRAEFVVMLARALNFSGAGNTLSFTDRGAIGDWASAAIARAAQQGIVEGFEDGSFRPNASITRAEMAIMIARALGLQIDAKESTGFADDEVIPSWAKGAIEAIRILGIVEGRDSNRFAPSETATRAEATVMLLRMLEQQQEE